MVSIAGSKKLKRQMAPMFWGLERKRKRFAITVKPGPHAKPLSIPTAVFLRDTLHLVSTLREAKSAIYAGKVKVDGVVRRSLHHGIGLMDVVDLENVKQAYRLLPGSGALLMPIGIPDGERKTKLCRVTSKNTIKGGRTQIGLHDGRTILTEEGVHLGDTAVIEVPGQKITSILALDTGSMVVITKGVNAGRIGTVEKILPGTFGLPRRALISLGDRSIEIQTDNTMVVGRDKPAIRMEA